MFAGRDFEAHECIFSEWPWAYVSNTSHIDATMIPLHFEHRDVLYMMIQMILSNHEIAKTFARKYPSTLDVARLPPFPLPQSGKTTGRSTDSPFWTVIGHVTNWVESSVKDHENLIMTLKVKTTTKTDIGIMQAYQVQITKLTVEIEKLNQIRKYWTTNHERLRDLYYAILSRAFVPRDLLSGDCLPFCVAHSLDDFL